VWLSDRVQSALEAGLAHGDAPSQLAKDVASQSGWPRRKLYNWIMEIQKNS